jgi:hypothetical protein
LILIQTALINSDEFQIYEKDMLEDHITTIRELPGVYTTNAEVSLAKTTQGARFITVALQLHSHVLAKTQSEPPSPAYIGKVNDFLFRAEVRV